MNVQTMGETRITRDTTYRTMETGGTPPAALKTRFRPEVEHWQSAIDEMLRWRLDGSVFEPEDRPRIHILDTAIDFAADQKEDESGGRAPTSIMPSGNGRVAMEWNQGSYTMIIEFVALGRAVCTEFSGGEVRNQYELKRNPVSRKLEIRG